MITAALFALAAAVGAVARTEAGSRWNVPDGVPYGILGVNVAGSLLLGLLWNVSPPTLTVLGIGGLGTFTTFSSFARDVVALTERRQIAQAAAYLIISLAAGVGAAALGISLVA